MSSLVEGLQDTMTLCLHEVWSPAARAAALVARKAMKKSTPEQVTAEHEKRKKEGMFTTLYGVDRKKVGRVVKALRKIGYRSYYCFNQMGE